MEPFEYHVYVCTQEKPHGLPCCSANGSAAVLEALRKAVMGAGLGDKVQITTCGSVGLCERGPNMIVYPEGYWYSKVQVDDVAEIVESHFEKDRPVERLLNADPAELKQEALESRRKTMAAMKAAQHKGD